MICICCLTCFLFAGLAFQLCFLPIVSQLTLSYKSKWKNFNYVTYAHQIACYYAGENTVSTLGRIVLIIWLFVVLIINSSYTASLTSILTVQQLASPIKGIESLIASPDPIGYQQGSYARDYLVEELKIHESRLIPLNSPEDFAKALRAGPRKGGVAAVVDERAYIELFLSTQCDFSIIGQEFTKAGWGFVSAANFTYISSTCLLA